METQKLARQLAQKGFILEMTRVLARTFVKHVIRNVGLAMDL